ncbi:MAG: 50S ribosomal protein L18Ae [Thermoplasmata archaeon]|nr:50S ribosomal protein L18Ae [Thermoplasmata archaeon]
MKAYRVLGEMEIAKRDWQRFSKEIAAENEDLAREKTLCDLGSRHGVKRRSLRIKKVMEIPPKDVTDQTILHQIGAD